MATKNKLHVSTRGISCKYFFLTSSLIMQKLVAVFHDVCTHVGGPKNFGDTGVPPFGAGAWLIPLETCSCTICATVPISVTLDQTVWT